MNDSSTGGYLAPAGPPAPIPLDDAALEDFMSALLAGLTGLTQDLVRPAWQPEPPDTPAAATSWMAHAVLDSEADTHAVELHDPTGQGDSQLQQHEEITWRLSSFGPNAWKLMGAVRRGLQIAQNREVLQLAGMGFVECGSAIPAPTIMKDKWRYRVDMPLVLRRQVIEQFSVLSLASAAGTLNTEVMTKPINTP